MRVKRFTGLLVAVVVFLACGVAFGQTDINYCNKYSSWIGTNCKVGSKYQNYGFCTGCMDTCRKIYNGNAFINEALAQPACKAFTRNYPAEPFCTFESSTEDPNRKLTVGVVVMITDEEMKKSAARFEVRDTDHIKSQVIGMKGDITNVDKIVGVVVTDGAPMTCPENLKLSYQVHCSGCDFTGKIERILVPRASNGQCSYVFNLDSDKIVPLLSGIEPGDMIHGGEKTADIFFQFSAPNGYRSKFAMRIVGNSNDLGRFATGEPIEMFFNTDDGFFGQFPLWLIK